MKKKIVRKHMKRMFKELGIDNCGYKPVLLAMTNFIYYNLLARYK